MDYHDYYETMGVSRDATQDEIKRAYRKLARTAHPDANPDDPTAEARFSDIAKAYEVLSDSEDRTEYDNLRLQAQRQPIDPGYGRWSSAPRDASTDQTVDITAIDHQTDDKLAGVKIRVVDPDGKLVGKEDTTDSEGSASVIVPGGKGITYRIVAIAPKTWTRIGDSDGYSPFGTLACADVGGEWDAYTCVYMHRDDKGTLTMPNRGRNVDEDETTVDNASFRFEVPKTTTEPIGEPVEPEDDDEIIIGSEPIGEPIETQPPAAETYLVCATVVHAPPADAPEFLSRIEIDVDAGPAHRDLSIVVPGANNGKPKVVDVATDTTVVGINSYGDYKIGTVLLGGVDVTPAFAGLPTITVDDQERTVWCHDTQPATAGTDEPTAAAGPAEQAATFLDAFNTAHETGDVDTLLDTLHPAARSTFGLDACDAHVRTTVGAVGSIELTDVGTVAPYELPAPGGPLVFPEAVEVEVDWVHQGESAEGVTFHLVLEDEGVFYLSTCGQPTS